MAHLPTADRLRLCGGSTLATLLLFRQDDWITQPDDIAHAHRFDHSHLRSARRFALRRSAGSYLDRRRPQDRWRLHRRVQGQQGRAKRRQGEEEELHRGVSRAAAWHADADRDRGGSGLSRSGASRTHADRSAYASGPSSPADDGARSTSGRTVSPRRATCRLPASPPAAPAATRTCRPATRGLSSATKAKPSRAGLARTVVWVNTKSKIYHHAGANTYGHTKEGAYMCEADATAEGDRLSKNGH